MFTATAADAANSVSLSVLPAAGQLAFPGTIPASATAWAETRPPDSQIATNAVSSATRPALRTALAPAEMSRPSTGQPGLVSPANVMSVA